MQSVKQKQTSWAKKQINLQPKQESSAAIAKKIDDYLQQQAQTVQDTLAGASLTIYERRFIALWGIEPDSLQYFLNQHLQ